MHLLEIQLKVEKKIVNETLFRIGIADKAKKILYPSCYLYEESGKTYLVNFKQLFLLQNQHAFDDMTEEDYNRRNGVGFLLKKWGLIYVSDAEIELRTRHIFVLPFKEKVNWIIKHKIKYRNI